MFPLYQSSTKKSYHIHPHKNFPSFPFILVYLVIPLLLYRMLVELVLLILEWFACLFYELDQRSVSKTNRCYDISYVIFYKNYY